MSSTGQNETVYHVTLLSNFARGFDKYTRRYNKAGIPESSFPQRFYLLKPQELQIGVTKASLLLDKLALPGDQLVALEAEIPTAQLKANLETGLGRYIESDSLIIKSVHLIDARTLTLSPLSLEEAAARSLLLLNPVLAPFDALRPRSVSLLPLARACQARCRFCFSAASVSVDQVQDRMDLSQVELILREARDRGAQRAVITGGGEPGLTPPHRLKRMVELCAENFSKVVLISNGYFLARLDSPSRASRMEELAHAGLTTLALSRHHASSKVNAEIMGLDTCTEEVLDTPSSLMRRLICVLQKGGVEDSSSLASYLDFAASHGIEEVCFKELYVSTTLESAYHEADANVWSYDNQIPLSMVTSFAQEHGFTKSASLPWGAPIFEGTWRGKRLRVAAYTEPSLFWERSHGVARSWNIMSDGRCLVSLEDLASEITFAARSVHENHEHESSKLGRPDHVKPVAVLH